MGEGRTLLVVVCDDGMDDTSYKTYALSKDAISESKVSDAEVTKEYWERLTILNHIPYDGIVTY